jgi:hypothetical protein
MPEIVKKKSSEDNFKGLPSTLKMTKIALLNFRNCQNKDQSYYYISVICTCNTFGTSLNCCLGCWTSNFSFAVYGSKQTGGQSWQDKISPDKGKEP